MTRLWNNTKTAMLLGGLFGIILLIGSYWGTQGLIMAFIFGGMMNVFAFFFSDKIAIASMQGQEADPRDDADLIEMVSRLARNANMPMPKVYICPHRTPNAFATGRSPSKAAVAVTQGAMQLLNYDELEGVIGHELAHIKNRDTLISTVAATIAGALNMLGWMLMLGGGGNRDGEGGNPLIALAMVIFAPIAAGLIQMAISRSREFVADHDGAVIAGSPHGLISALRKLEAMNERIPLATNNPTQNHMFIVEPFSGKHGITKLFMTHPPTEQRVAALQKMAGDMRVAAA